MTESPPPPPTDEEWSAGNDYLSPSLPPADFGGKRTELTTEILDDIRKQHRELNSVYVSHIEEADAKNSELEAELRKKDAQIVCLMQERDFYRISYERVLKQVESARNALDLIQRPAAAFEEFPHPQAHQQQTSDDVFQAHRHSHDDDTEQQRVTTMVGGNLESLLMDASGRTSPTQCPSRDSVAEGGLLGVEEGAFLINQEQSSSTSPPRTPKKVHFQTYLHLIAAPRHEYTDLSPLCQAVSKWCRPLASLLQ